jgi:hypothetical protein
MSARVILHWCYDACFAHYLAENLFINFIKTYSECCDAAIATVGEVFSKQKTGLGRGRSRDTRTPKNPVFGPAKKSSLPPAKMCKKWGFWAKKRAFSVNLCTILHKNDLFFADIAPRYRAASPSGKNPPIYTVLNAAFSAPGPPRLWHRGGTPVPDALPRAPDTRFAKIDKIDFFKTR